MPLSPAEVRDAAIEANARTKVSARHYEKDFYVTQVLRALAENLDGRVEFKGGTSLSKGYGLIERFSEDIDLLVKADPDDDDAVVDGVLDEITATAVAALGAGGRVHEQTRTPGRSGVVRLAYPASAPKQGSGIGKYIVLEPGRRGGPVPSERRVMHAMLADAIPDIADAAGGDFEMEVLHPARTLIEKVLAVHSLGQNLIEDPSLKVPGRMARHFYDIDRLLNDEHTVLPYLADPAATRALIDDCLAVTALWFGPDANPALGESLADAAVFDEQLRGRLEPAYMSTCNELCHPDQPIPGWDEVLATMERSRGLLLVS